jgi:hypothetical protein
VPFGTGQVINKLLSEDNNILSTYLFESFFVLRDIFLSVDLVYINQNIESVIRNDILKDFCLLYGINLKVSELISNCSSIDIFRKRFFHIFDSFVILKWLNFAAENGFDKSELKGECFKLFLFLNVNLKSLKKDKFSLLEYFRRMDRGMLNED